MKVKELIMMLAKYNQEADVNITVHNRFENFTISYIGDGEGMTESNCKGVSFYVDRLNGNDAPIWDPRTIRHES